MAAGDVYAPAMGYQLAQNAYYNMQPDAGVEVVVHNITHGTDATLEIYDSTANAGAGVAITVDTQAGNGAWMGMFLHCTNTRYYRVKNTNAAASNICCDGMVTK